MLHSEFRAIEPSHQVNEALEMLRKVYMGEISMGKTRKRRGLL